MAQNKRNTTLNFIDRAISLISPEWGFKRSQYRQAMALQQRAYDAAGRGRRTDKWKAQSTSANQEVHNALTLLRDRSREMCRNNPYATKAIAELANNIVGTGIMPTPIFPDNKNPALAEKLKTAFKAWADSTSCDYDGHLNYWGLQHLAARAAAESGEVIIRKHIVKDKSLAIPLQLQVLEGDYIDTTKYIQGAADGGYIYYGVEFDKNNKIVAYWLWNNHPGDNWQFNLESSRVPADEIIHYFVKERPGQFRGVPMGHASMLRLRDFDEYEDAQLIRQKIASCFTVFVSDNSINPVSGQQNSDNDDMLERVEPGIIEHLPQGKTVQMATPPDAGNNYESYTKGTLRGIAAGYGMDYVTLTGDLTGVNFSSGRMGWLQFHRNITCIQWNNFVPIVCDKSWKWFMQIAVIFGYAKTTAIMVSWTPPRREMIDPTKEVTAQIEAIRGGLTSWQNTARQNGENPDDLMAEIAEDKANFDKVGIIMQSDPRYENSKTKPKTTDPPQP